MNGRRPSLPLFIRRDLRQPVLTIDLFILLVTSKLLERVIANQIRNYLAGNNLLHSAQHGLLMAGLLALIS